MVILSFLLRSIDAGGQGENNIWILRNDLALDFNTVSPGPLYEGNALVWRGQMATVCDHKGNLLFYSDGEVVRNRDHDVMPNGEGLRGYASAQHQGILAVPTIFDSKKYYLFTVEDLPAGRPLHYSVLDMRMDNGFGDLVPSEKNIHLADGIGPGIIAVQGNCDDIWVLVHEARSKKFHAYNISSHGVSDPVISDGGHDITGITTKLMASPNSQRIAIRHAALFVEVFDFDPVSGLLTNSLFLDEFPITRGLDAFCFSPNSRFLYIAVNIPRNSSQLTQILQFDLTLRTADSIRNSAIPVGYPKYFIEDMQIGPDGIIYVGSRNYIGTINKPDQKGLASQYVDSSLYLGDLYKGQNFQNLVVLSDTSTRVPSDILPSDTTLCDGDTVWLVAAHTDFVYLWHDGSTDSTYAVGSSGEYWVEISRGLCRSRDTISVSFTELPQPDLGPDFSFCPGESYTLVPALSGVEIIWGDSLRVPTLTVDRPGTYDVVAIRDGCAGRDTIEVHGVHPPELLKNDTTLCPGDFLDLSLEETNVTVTWDDGTSDPVRRVTGPGIYSLVVYQDDCSFRDTVVVTESMECDGECAVYVPNVFSPNGDGLNDSFAVQTSCHFEYYELYIFSRWGVLVFHSKDPNAVWHATEVSLPDVFVYLLKYRTSADESIVKKGGDITLVQ